MQPLTMPLLQVDLARLDARTRGDVLIVPAVAPRGRLDLLPPPGLATAVSERLAELIAAWQGGREAGALDASLAPPRSACRRIVVVSLGSSQRPGLSDVRAASAAAARWCAARRAAHAVVWIDGLQRLAGDEAVAAWAEAAVLAGFRYDRFRKRRSADDRPPARLARMTLAAAVAPVAALRGAVADAVVAAESVNLARAYGHEPPNVINPVTLARAAAVEARRCGLRCRALDERGMARLRMGALLAVGAGSATPPRLIVLEHPGRRPESRPIVLVGKAVTLDTGGYSIKPADGIPDMKYDKCGGMAVLAALVAAARLKLDARVIGVIAAAENMIDKHAYRPGDILTASSGTTIEVVNTDAEGRLLLADALHYAQKQFRPRALIDLATLTGACTVALGHAAAGLFCNRDDLAARLIECGEASGDRLWRMPLWPEYRKQIAAGDADVKNSGGRPGGAATAAAFLREFVNDAVPWAHLDIAGVAHTDKDSPLCPRGATGFGVRLLLRYLRNQESAAAGRRSSESTGTTSREA